MTSRGGPAACGRGGGAGGGARDPGAAAARRAAAAVLGWVQQWLADPGAGSARLVI